MPNSLRTVSEVLGVDDAVRAPRLAPIWLALPPLSVLLALWLYDDVGEVVGFIALLAIGSSLAMFLLDRERRAYRDLLRTQFRISGITHALDAMLWECDTKGKITFISERVMAHFGYPPEEAREMSLHELIHPREARRLTAFLQAGTGWRNEQWRCLHKDGHEEWFLGNATPIRDDLGNLMGYSGSSYPLGGNAAEEQRRPAAADEIYARLETRDFTSMFQPIISVSTGRLIGAEALSRFPGSSKSPEQWFVDAAETGLAVELDLATLEAALHAAHLLPRDVYISLNVSPATLTRHRLLTSIEASGVDPHRIVLELTEHSSILDYEPVLEALGRLRRVGIRLAIDDAGAGYASFRHILRLAPEFIKLDRSLVAGIDADPAKRALSSAVVAFGVEMHATILAEGVESAAEFHTLRGLGIDAAQGYLFGKASADWATWSEWHASGPLLSASAVARLS